MVQSVITNQKLATGVVGEFARSTNQDSVGKMLDSADESMNKVGVIVKYSASDSDVVGVAQDGNIAGILGCPKVLQRATLQSQDFVNNATQVEIITRGYVFVHLTAVAAVGDYLYYSDTDGTLATATPDTVPPLGYTRVNGGKVTGMNVTEAGLAEVYIDIEAGSTETPSA